LGDLSLSHQLKIWCEYPVPQTPIFDETESKGECVKISLFLSVSGMQIAHLYFTRYRLQTDNQICNQTQPKQLNDLHFWQSRIDSFLKYENQYTEVLVNSYLKGLRDLWNRTGSLSFTYQSNGAQACCKAIEANLHECFKNWESEYNALNHLNCELVED